MTTALQPSAPMVPGSNGTLNRLIRGLTEFMGNSVRVLMVCPQFYPLVGGYEKAAERLSLALSERGHRVTVVTERRDRSLPPREKIGLVNIRRLPSSMRRGTHTISTILSLSLYLLIRGRSFDVVHVHQYGWPSTVALLFGIIARRPVSLKLTSTGPQGIGPVLDQLPGSGLHRWLHRKLSACIATSERARTEMVDLGLDASKVHVIPNGLDTENFAPASDALRMQARQQLGLDESPLVVTVCRMSPEKNLPVLLEAWAQVRNQIPGVRLAIVGDGGEMIPVKKIAERLQLGPSLLLPGHSPDPKPWYAAADLYVLSSLNEGLSNSLMEALSCGLPIVSTRVSGSEDIVAAANVGLLVAVDDPEALERALSEMLADSERLRACGLRACEYAQEHFALQAVTEKIERLYLSLLPKTFGDSR